MYRHGDLLIVKSKVPTAAKPVKDGILAYGEVTGHAHRVVGGAAVLEHEGVRYINATAGASVVHEEHRTIQLPPGDYQVIIQREWSPYDEAARRVSD